MTVRHDYTCNLCHGRLGVQDGDDVGVVFEGKGVRFKIPLDSNNHLCSGCLEAIREELGALDKRNEVRARLEAVP